MSLPEHRIAYSVAEVADLVGCSRGLIYRLAREGTLRTSRIGRRTVIRVAELDRFLAAEMSGSEGRADD